ncbi:MAG: 16S rRNA processing protein RimM [bacterium]|nr:16S rRNA processing protein RimM [bacterium]
MEYFLIARIEQLYGKDGYVRIKSFSDFPERFLRLKKVYLDFWGDKKAFYIEDIKDVKGSVLVKFERFDSIRDSQLLLEREIYVAEKDAVTLPENHFFVHDIIGSEIIIEEECLGVITDIIKGKGNDVLVVKADDKKEILIPFVLSFIEKFDAAEKKLILNIKKDFFEDDQD